MIHRRSCVLFASLALAALAGCQNERDFWQGGVKYLKIHAVAFTAQGRGLVVVAPADAERINSTAYYHIDLQTMNGRRLAHGQHALGQPLVCPWGDWVAVPTYFKADGRSGPKPGYQLCDTQTGAIVRRVAVESPAMFAPSRGATTQPGFDAVAAWRHVSPLPLTREQESAVRAARTAWVSRGGPQPAGVTRETVGGDAFHVLASPDGRHRLFVRFNGAGGKPAKAADPDADGYAYGFLADATGKRYPLFTTTSGHETWGRVGSAVVGGPVWLGRQIGKAFTK